MPRGTPKQYTPEELEARQQEAMEQAQKSVRRLAVKQVALIAQEKGQTNPDVLDKFQAWESAHKARMRIGSIPARDTLMNRISRREKEIQELQTELDALRLAEQGDSSGLDALRDVDNEDFTLASSALIAVLPEAQEAIEKAQ